MKLTSNFRAEEFIHPAIWNKIGDRAVDFLNPRLVPTCQQLRDIFGPIIVNDWYIDGRFEDSGLRMPQGIVGAALSSHRFGCAADLKLTDIDPISVQQHIIRHREHFPYVTRMENAEITKTWLHLETGIRHGEIHVFDP